MARPHSRDRQRRSRSRCRHPTCRPPVADAFSSVPACLPRGWRGPLEGVYVEDLGLLLPIALFLLLWLVLIRPQQKRRKEQQQMVRALAVGDDVVTVGGLHARVVALTEQTMDVTVDADGDVVLRFERASLGRVVRDDLTDDVEDDEVVAELEDEVADTDAADDRDA